MKIHSFCLLASLLMFSSTALLADLSIPYGEGTGKVDYSNNNKFEDFEEPLPYGPLSFRMVGDKIWVADTVGGKLMQYDNKGKLISEFSVVPDGGKAYTVDNEGFPNVNLFIEDFAPVLGEYGDVKAWWVVDSVENRLLKFSPEGNILAALHDDEFGQLFRVEVGRSGHLFVADKGTRKIYIYDSEGNYLSDQNWEWSGMAVAGKNDYLYRLIYFNEEDRNILVATDVEGKVIKSKTLDVEMDNPELWWVDEVAGEAVITYTPKTGFDGYFNIVRVGLDGKVRATGKLLAPLVMNRFIDNLDYSEVYIGKCNFAEAPKGNFEIVPFEMPK